MGKIAYTRKSAFLSDCGEYRYVLNRWWNLLGIETGHVVWIMLNPSTADADLDDPTIKKCVGFTHAMGHSHLSVVNLFALRETHPEKMYAHASPIGPDNDSWIETTTAGADVIVLAWGAVESEKGKERGRIISHRLRDKNPLCLSKTKKGYPGHPLFIPYSVKPFPFFSESA